MARRKGICKVCGKEYLVCITATRYPGVFYWQDVACCPECGREYLRQVEEARASTKTNNTNG